jgi:hypothetical protein
MTSPPNDNKSDPTVTSVCSMYTAPPLQSVSFQFFLDYVCKSFVSPPRRVFDRVFLYWRKRYNDITNIVRNP